MSTHSVDIPCDSVVYYALEDQEQTIKALVEGTGATFYSMRPLRSPALGNPINRMRILFACDDDDAEEVTAAIEVAVSLLIPDHL